MTYGPQPSPQHWPSMNQQGCFPSHSTGTFAYNSSTSCSSSFSSAALPPITEVPANNGCTTAMVTTSCHVLLHHGQQHAMVPSTALPQHATAQNKNCQQLYQLLAIMKGLRNTHQLQVGLSPAWTAPGNVCMHHSSTRQADVLHQYHHYRPT